MDAFLFDGAHKKCPPAPDDPLHQATLDSLEAYLVICKR